MTLHAMIKNWIPQRWRASYYMTALVQRRTGLRVRTGPFQGMRYGRNAFASVYLPKLLGIYERELHATVERVCALQPDRIIDIGAAEGYYAVGLARRNTQAEVIAFETTADARAALGEMAQLNEVAGRIEIRGKCETESLAAALEGSQRPLIVCDVEGYELTLLDPDRIPALGRAYLLIELHDFVDPQLSSIIRERFQDSHQVEQIWQSQRSFEDEFPYDNFYTQYVPKVHLRWVVDEFRPAHMSWLWLAPSGYSKV
jgi:hypothetical protein